MRLNSTRFINSSSFNAGSQEAAILPNACEQNVHHQRNRCQIGPVIFSSDFDCGNMLKAEKDYSSLGNNFNVWICPDAYLTTKEMKYRTWFYFSVTGVSANNLINITIKNTNFQQKLYREGHQPVFKSSNSNLWQRVTSNVANTIVQHETGIDITFSHTFSDPEEQVFFAFTYPWSYVDNQEMLDLLENKLYNDKDIYFHRTTLVKSKEFRNVELLTISSHSHRLKEKMALNGSSNIVFPVHNPPDLFSDKKYVFISTRVHPGEVPGSHVFNGMLSLLLDKSDPRSKVLREEFVFVMVPMINPDGVSRGHYRTDSAGQNLNRFYISPSPNEQPEVYGIKELLLYLHSRSQLFSYLDLHAHATKRGSFIYGNCMDYRSQVDSNLLTKLMALNSPYFEYELCNFSERNMYSKDKSDGLSKEGSGRVALYKQTNIPLCYTLECNYNMPNQLNALYPRSDKYAYEDTQEEFPGVNVNIVLQNANYEQTQASQPYVPAHYSQLGEGMLEALLDFIRKNPSSRIKNSPYKNFTNLKMQIAYQTMRQIPYRFEGYLRNVTRAIQASTENNYQASFKILHNYVTKGLKSPLLVDKENTSGISRNQPRKSTTLQQSELQKKKAIIPSVMSFPSKALESKGDAQIMNEAKQEKAAQIKPLTLPPSSKNRVRPSGTTGVDISLKDAQSAKRYLESIDSSGNVNGFEREAETHSKPTDLLASRPSYKSNSKQDSGNLKINRIIEQAKQETKQRHPGSSSGRTMQSQKKMGYTFSTSKQQI